MHRLLSAVSRRFDKLQLMAGSCFRRATNTETLSEIGKRHGTDKGNEFHTFHLSYLDIFERYLSSYKDKSCALLEIGVKDGASLRMWREYLNKSSIYGLDIDPRCKDMQDQRIEVIIGSQDDTNVLAKLPNELDIIVDDGSHLNEHIVCSMEYLFYNKLKSGGVYIIEDLFCSYLELEREYNVKERWPGMSYNDEQVNMNNDRKVFDEYILNKIKEMDHRRGQVLSISFWSQLCIVQKV